ncbi:hypothetical protein FQN55_003311 [Onygenales sp. PD_40]|nr:hypothetical protein FQN55_003311 [Onygenales sp. PD_40]
MPSLASIPLEIFDIIAADLSKQEFINLSTVCKRLRSNTIPWMVRDVRIEASADGLIRLQKLSTSPFAEYVRTVCYHVSIPVEDLQGDAQDGMEPPLTIEPSLANSLASFPQLQLCKFEHELANAGWECPPEMKSITTHAYRVPRVIGLLQDLTSPHRGPPDIVLCSLGINYYGYPKPRDRIFLDLFRYSLRGIKSLHIQKDLALLISLAGRVCLPSLATFKVTGAMYSDTIITSRSIDLLAFAAFISDHAKTLKTLHVFSCCWYYDSQLYDLGDPVVYPALQDRLSNDKAWRSSALEEVVFKMTPDDEAGNSRLEQLLLGSAV